EPLRALRSRRAWRVWASVERPGKGEGRDGGAPSPFPVPRNSTTPFRIGYSFRHTGHPSMPDRTIRPTISPVDITRKASSCVSGQRSISVNSMCTGTEHHPGEAARRDANPPGEPLPVHHDRERVVARLHITHGEALAVRGVGAAVLGMRLG